MKKLIVVILILAIFVSAGIIYLNKVYLPAKIKQLIIQGIQDQTSKKVSLDSVRFNIFKGLVFNNLILYGQDKAILSLKEGSCSFLIWPFFKKQLVITNLRLDSAVILLERNPDNTFNWQSVLSQKPASSGKGGFGLLIYKVSIINSRIDYHDAYLNPAFERSITDLNLVANFSLPASLKFKLKGLIPGKSQIKISAQGEYNIPRQELSAKFSIFDIAPADFFAYYKNAGIEVSGGILDISGGAILKDGWLGTDITSKAKNIIFSKEEIAVTLNADIQAKFDYELKSEKFKYSGNAKIYQTDISGIDSIKEVKVINGLAQFDNSAMKLEKVNARVLGLPVQAKASIFDFANPKIELDITGDLPLVSLKNILKDKFKLDLPIIINGQSRMALNLKLEPLSDTLPILNGYLDLADTSIKLEKLDPAFEGVSGRINFTFNGLSWKEVNFKFLNEPYKTNGALANFERPVVELTVVSDNLKLESNISVNNKVISVSKFSANYLNSAFSLSGDIDTGNKPQARLLANADIEIGDLDKISTQFKEQLTRIKPNGKVKAKFNLTGNLADIKACAIEGQVTSEKLSLWGFKGTDLSIAINQQEGILEVSQGHLALYDGVIDLTGKMNLFSGNLPFWIEFSAKDIKIEKLNLDTSAKDKDIAGSIQAQGKISSFVKDFSKMTGAGKILVTQGKLWELNLFKGMGKFIFARDFANIVVSEASCPFVIQDGSIATDNLKMVSNLAEITGPVKIGFDGSVYSELNVNILGDSAPDTGTFKDIATAIVGTAGKFGTITLSGTLKDPKYKFKPAVADIFNSIKNAIFGN
ncbi:MAG: DUF3971 domain-containing protein [Candidatus Omnitrophica bacterium]|nr:DUF3971 domain-containing protein [Candidatus Omnitrophota bacterium]